MKEVNANTTGGSAVLDQPVAQSGVGTAASGLTEQSKAPFTALMRFMPSFTDVAFLIPVLFLFAKLEGVKTMLGDGDTGWHIRTGEWILRNHRVPTTDLFSYTMPDQKWFAWEWLWDISFAPLHRFWGLAGVVWVSLIVLCLTSVLVYRLAYKNSGNALVGIGLTGLAMAGSAIHWLARPHLFTLLFTAVFMLVMQRFTSGVSSRRLLWALPFLTILWTNLHGGFFVGVIMLGAYAGGELVRAALAETAIERREAAGASLPYIYAAAGCLAASLVNPYTYHLHQHIVEFFQDPFQFKYILEFQSANFRSGGAQYFEAMLVLAAFGALWLGRRKRYAEILLLAGWAHLALTTVRNIPIFMMTAAVLLAEPVADWVKSACSAPLASWWRTTFTTFSEISEELNPLERGWRFHVLPAVVLIVLALASNTPAAGEKFQAEYSPKNYPAAALPELTRFGSGIHIFADDEWGDYLIYKLSPLGIKVFVDGRSDFYGGKFDQPYIDAMNVSYNWEKLMARYQVDTLLLHADAALAGAVKESRNWQVVYDDGRAIVFRHARDTPGAKQVSTVVQGGRRTGVNP